MAVESNKAFKHKPLGHKKMLSLFQKGQMFFCGMMTNSRKAHCKVCGNGLTKGQGIRWLKFGPNNDFHFQPVYLCHICNTYWTLHNFEFYHESSNIFRYYQVDDISRLIKSYQVKFNL